MKLLPAGDRALVAEFGDTIDPEVNRRVHCLAAALLEQKQPGILELVPTFRSLLIHYDPSLLSWERLCRILKKLESSDGGKAQERKIIRKIPCCYGSHFGPDLPALAQEKGLTRDEIVALHSGKDYKIYMLGFLPGFVYLGELDKRLEAGRLPAPRLKIPKGSVGIGGSQTGVYPLDSPGGWRLIGATPLDFYDAGRDEPVMCHAGEYIRFCPITSSEYYDIRQMILKGKYQPEILSL